MLHLPLLVMYPIFVTALIGHLLNNLHPPHPVFPYVNTNVSVPGTVMPAL